MNERTEGARGRGLHWGNLRRKQGSSMPSWQKSKESHGSQGLGREPSKTDLIPSQWKEQSNRVQFSEPPEAGYLALNYDSQFIPVK